MSLNLDSRQRAMLAEMGVRFWWPQASEAPAVPTSPGASSEREPEAPETADLMLADESVAEGAQRYPDAEAPAWQPPPVPAHPPAAPVVPAMIPKAPPVQPGPPPDAVLPLPDGIAGMDWPTLRATVASCQACAMCLGRRAPVLAAPASGVRADWFIVGEPPDDEQERAGQAFVGEAGRLLDNMLKAVGVRRCTGANDATDPDPAGRAYLTPVLKCRPALPNAPDAQALAACSAYLQREIALVQPKVILSMGRLAMQVLLSQDHPQGLRLPLGKLRGQVWRYQGVPVVVTYPPAYLLRSGQDKARAWQDLCLALDVAQDSAETR